MNPVVLTGKTPKNLEDVPISRELVEWLEKTVPERCPGIMDTERQIWMYAGERSLVRKLRAAFDKQQNRGGVIQ